MAQIEKNATAENHEKRENVRLDEYRHISVKDLKAGIFHKATMLNYSKNGMYFETDSILQPGAEIYLGIENPSQASFVDEFECKLAEIKWRKKLKKSFYNYGYGIKFISADNTKELKSGNQREGIDSRKHPRKPYSKSVLYAANNQILEGTSQNISLSGIFIKTKEKLSVGQKVILSLPSKIKKRLKIRGEVVWSTHEGFGVKFLKKMGE
ncbi:MAG: PilZ domain-containing protein [Desulfobacterales bacterium]|nr:PilZ domain-containing protein [Desulfobacterales bacterium]